MNFSKNINIFRKSQKSENSLMDENVNLLVFKKNEEKYPLSLNAWYALSPCIINNYAWYPRTSTLVEDEFLYEVCLKLEYIKCT